VCTQFSVPQLRNDPDLIDDGKKGLKCYRFEIIRIADLGARFAGQKPFVTELQSVVPDFYNRIGQRVRAWQPPAPKVTEGRGDASKVTPAALAEDAEADYLELTNKQ
jgi:hypothetical protein